MGVDESDAEVVASSLARPARFAVLYERHVARVAGYLARRVGREHAEDLTAEVFVRAFRVRARFRAERDSALPWLLGIAGHLIADHRREERRRLAALQRLAIATPEASSNDRPNLAPETVRRLRRLPAADRDALLLVVWGELSYAEAAEALGVPIGTVRSRIARARDRLAAAIGAEAQGAVGRGSASSVEEGEMNV
jgi:RNA polymerase sigma-70 factor (ECF subfamily)